MMIENTQPFMNAELAYRRARITHDFDRARYAAHHRWIDQVRSRLQQRRRPTTPRVTGAPHHMTGAPQHVTSSR